MTESEAQRFWPLREDYQRDLQKINQRIVALIERYAADYRNKSLTDEKAKPLIDEAVSIEQAEAQLKKAYVPKLSKVLPAKKVARYMQIENKIRAIVKYDLASAVPSSNSVPCYGASRLVSVPISIGCHVPSPSRERSWSPPSDDRRRFLIMPDASLTSNPGIPTSTRSGRDAWGCPLGKEAHNG